MKKVVVLSLGGSLIIPENINFKFLKEFREIINKNTVAIYDVKGLFSEGIADGIL